MLDILKPAEAGRKLAERSQVASQEIGEVAKKQCQPGRAGREAIGGNGTVYQRTTDLVQEICAASTEQSTGATQINKVMEQLNSMTQQSASSSEELASTSEVMSGQLER